MLNDWTRSRAEVCDTGVRDTIQSESEVARNCLTTNAECKRMIKLLTGSARISGKERRGAISYSLCRSTSRCCLRSEAREQAAILWILWVVQPWRAAITATPAEWFQSPHRPADAWAVDISGRRATNLRHPLLQEIKGQPGKQMQPKVMAVVGLGFVQGLAGSCCRGVRNR